MPPLRFRRLLPALLAATAAVAAPSVAVVGVPAADALTTINGPDVASYQHPNGARINWSAVAADHKEFAIVKATEGTSYTNPYFATDYSRVKKAGMVRGSYHFARPAYPLVKTAKAQANYFVAKLGSSLSTAKTLPPALDLEVTGGLSRSALVTWAQTFLLQVRTITGRTPLIYTYPYFWSNALADRVALKRFPLWMAAYDGEVDPAATLWQYTAGARVDGIRGHVDMSRLIAPNSVWSELADGRVTQPWGAAEPGAPIRVRATPGSRSATVSWMPGDAGSTFIRRYRVTAHPGGAYVVVGGSYTHATITGLDNGTAYTFTVRARNDIGPGPESLASAPVTPMVPTHFSVDVPTSRTYGDNVPVRAVLRRSDTGAALAGRHVSLQLRRHGTSTWTTSTSLTTDANGRISRWLHPTRSVDVRLSYGGRTGWEATRATRAVIIRSGVTAHLSDNRVRRNHAVYLYGRIDPHARGIKVLREGFYNGAWHVWDRMRTSSTGRYRFKIVPTVRSVNTYRVVVTSYGGRGRGFSRTLKLTVL